MTDFILQPVTLRTIQRPAGNIVIDQVGATARVNGVPCTVIEIATIRANSKHFLRNLLPALDKAAAVAVVLAKIDGKDAQLTLNADAWANGAAERRRYADWASETAARNAAGRAFFDGMNEGGEGYNPYRA